MTLALAPTVTGSPSRRPVRRGWRPRYPGEFPTLGWQILDWASAYLPSPRDERQALRLTDEQARRVLCIYELDPLTGKRLSRRVIEEEAKGWGKGPFGAVLMLAEFRGPVLCDGWDANGQPVGHPWGFVGTPAPWIQAAAKSEAQTANVWTAMYGLIGAREGRVADALGIDKGRTRLYATDMAGAFMERVTSASGTREGQPITHALIDEAQLLDPSNDGDELVRTILRNLTKTGGWGHITQNAPVVGAESVAEQWWDEPGEGVLRFATRPTKVPTEKSSDGEKLAALGEVYQDVPWMLDHLDRVLLDINDPTAAWGETLRYFFNSRTSDDSGSPAWMPRSTWDKAAGDVVMSKAAPTFAVVRLAHDHRSAAVAVAQRHGDRGISLRVRTFPDTPQPAGEFVPVDVIEDYLRGLHRRYPAFVIAVKRYHAKGRDHLVPQHGPEVVYHGAFFEGSKQKLERDGIVFLDIPDTNERLAPAAEALKGAVLEGRLIHDGNAELARQVCAVVAEEAAKGWRVAEGGPAARSAMIAVHRVLTAPRPPSRQMHFGGRPS